ncbi:hypothetical protein BC832DRAFT_613974 [Gaertneriomyces semiglobifer]|nr:hypothetical protein BC832DRAFT_613974 [Gaertneriomyces semiglobifer]
MSAFDKLRNLMSSSSYSAPDPDFSAEPGQDEDILAHAAAVALTHETQSVPATISANIPSTSDVKHAAQSTFSTHTDRSDGFDRAAAMASRISDSIGSPIDRAKEAITGPGTSHPDVSIGHKIAGTADYARFKANEGVDSAKDQLGLSGGR